MNLSYPEVGASLTDPMPAGYRHLRYRTPIGHGPTKHATIGGIWPIERAFVLVYPAAC